MHLRHLKRYAPRQGSTTIRPAGHPKAVQRRIAEITRLNNVTLQVLPFEAGAHPGMDSAFTILGFPERGDPNVVYVEYRAGSLYLEDPAEVDTYNVIFDHLRARALGPDESLALIAKVVKDLV
ncbi:DUF5753 domain-containing protein [Sphaerisporangium sp. NPDC088356]|uniref:DUF5753 domain-containing protein n=1 Tax=Sphaerisporangium sp. NPDC088356 TaxID=3154871 RepID=UPI00342596FA